MTVNLAKMRNQLARGEALDEEREQRRWLASMTPEHRAAHERFGLCGVCMGNAFATMGKIAGLASTASKQQAGRQ